MEPNIEIDSNVLIIYHDMYKKRLAEKIKFVCSKIGFPYNNIKWIIFDPKKSDIYGNKPKYLQQFLIGSQGKDFGACTLDGEIWISTLSIQNDYVENNPLKKLNKYININAQNKEDFLANVILDEIAHISTQSDHGNTKYDKELSRLKSLYYGFIKSLYYGFIL